MSLTMNYFWNAPRKKNRFFLTSYRGGFTLVETLVTILLFTFLTAAIYGTVVVSNHSVQMNQVQIEVDQDLRIARDRILADMSQTSSGSIINVTADGSWYTSIQFRIPSGVDSSGQLTWPSETVEYSLGGASSNEVRRVTEDGGSTTEDRVISENVSTLQFRRQAATPDLLEVNMAAQKSIQSTQVSSSLSFKVKLRNG